MTTADRAGLRWRFFTNSLRNHIPPLLVLTTVLLAGGMDAWGAAFIAVPVVVYLLFLFWVCAPASTAAPKPSGNWFFLNAVASCAFISAAYALGGEHRLAALAWCVPLVWSSAAVLGRRKTLALVMLCLALPLHGYLLHSLWTSQQVDWARESLTSLTLIVLLSLTASASEHHRALKTAHERANAHLRRRFSGLLQKSMLDHLTGAFNRPHMMRVIYAEAARCRRNQRSFALCMIDLDHFKSINDQHGHHVGDQVLVGFCDLARRVLGESRIDAIARWGGEEFIVVLPEISHAEALSKILALRAAVHAHAWHAIAPQLSVTFSAGLTMYRGDMEVDEVIEQADSDMYRAKMAGRDGVFSDGVMCPDTRAPALHSQGVWGRLGSSLGPSGPARVEAVQPTQRIPDRPESNADTFHLAKKPVVSLVESSRFSRAARLLQQGLSAVASNRPDRKALQLGAMAYLCALLMLGFLADQGVSAEGMGLLAVHVSIGMLAQWMLAAFAPRIRRTLASLVFWQICWGVVGMSLALVVLPAGAPYLIMAFCVFPVFSVFAGTPSDVSKCLATAAIGLFVTLFYQSSFIKGNDEALQRVLLLQGFSTILAMVVIGARSIAHSESWQRASNEREKLLQVSEEITETISRDGLTGALNRQFMQHHLEIERERHARSGVGFCVMILDLDHFKAINDTHGHAVGDAVLVGFAQRVQSVVRTTDSFCRWGGEEFLVCLSDVIDAGGAKIVMERIFAAVRCKPLCESRPDLVVTFSAGLTLHRMHESVISVVSRADEALYQAKAAGRNTHVFADEDMAA